MYRGRQMSTNILCTNFLNTPRHPEYPRKIPMTSQEQNLFVLGLERRERTFEGGNELSDPHPFARKTPPHQAVSGTTKQIFVLFFLPANWLPKACLGYSLSLFRCASFNWEQMCCMGLANASMVIEDCCRGAVAVPLMRPCDKTRMMRQYDVYPNTSASFSPNLLKRKGLKALNLDGLENPTKFMGALHGKMRLAKVDMLSRCEQYKPRKKLEKETSQHLSILAGPASPSTIQAKRTSLQNLSVHVTWDSCTTSVQRRTSNPHQWPFSGITPRAVRGQ